MIFVHKLNEVLDGSKTQTRRLFKPGEALCGFAPGKPNWTHAVISNGRVRYKIDSTYAVCPGRTKPAVARIRIVDIREEDVRNISEEDAIAEGFIDKANFLAVWTYMYDAVSSFAWDSDKNYYIAYRGNGHYDHMGDFASIEAILRSRPDERYHAWALTFEVVP